ncbi:hypothetical protein FCM35_KLT08070 [Carex littledalei]|uniref:Uncharacterized protein n=1 Tax=Carex littledalei TaxID=544730 RepID=A0A833QHA7_9POAL|nr:hypothetical protein FCM35_KLT08070 [Carex littledalei]
MPPQSPLLIFPRTGEKGQGTKSSCAVFIPIVPNLDSPVSPIIGESSARSLIRRYFLICGTFSSCHESSSCRKLDIPALVAEACKEHRGVSYVITAPFSLHELLVDVMSDRIKHCVSHVAGVDDECDVYAGTGRCRLYP